MKQFLSKVKKGNNNKGFTLVELIIVVAIIAVLAAVLAPQYLQYVERARQSNDLQVATSIMRASTVALADPRNEVPANTTFTVTWTTESTATPTLTVDGSTDAVDARILNDVAEVMGWAALNTTTNVMEYDASAVDGGQSANAGIADLEFTVNAATGSVELTTASAAQWGPTGIGIDD